MLVQAQLAPDTVYEQAVAEAHFRIQSKRFAGRIRSQNIDQQPKTTVGVRPAAIGF